MYVQSLSVMLKTSLCGNKLIKVHGSIYSRVRTIVFPCDDSFPTRPVCSDWSTGPTT